MLNSDYSQGLGGEFDDSGLRRRNGFSLREFNLEVQPMDVEIDPLTQLAKSIRWPLWFPRASRRGRMVASGKRAARGHWIRLPNLIAPRTGAGR